MIKFNKHNVIDTETKIKAMKTYSDQQYPHELTVVVTEKDSNGFVTLQWLDGHKGLNAGHALYLAKQNWEGLQVTPYTH